MTDLRAAAEALRSGEESERQRAVLELGACGAGEAIPLLLRALADASWLVRQSAGERLVAFDRRALLPALDAALRDGDNADVRNASMEVYVKLGPAAAEPLLALLVDADEEVRNFAAVMLGSLRDPRAIGPLIDALRDPDVNVRHAAAASLGQLGAREAVPALIDALGQEPWLQYPAIHALGEIGDPRASPGLLPLLDDDLLRGPALEALRHVAGREALPRVVLALRDPDPALRNLAIRALVEIEQRAAAGGDTLDPDVQAALRRDDLIDHLLAMLADDDPQLRRTGAITLGWLREPRAERPLIDLLDEPLLHDHVSHALVSIGGLDEAAYRYGLAHASDQVRMAVARCLSWIAPPGASALVAPLIHDPSADVRAEAVTAIGRLGHEDAAMLLFELLGDESELIQERAMAALAQLAPEQVVPLLLQALASPEPQVLTRAAETLALLRDARAAEPLLRLAGDAREGVRRAALRALGELEHPEIPGLLRRALHDPSGLVRQQAALSLGKLEEPEAAVELLPLLDDEDPKLRFVALRALGQIRNPDVVPRLIPFLADRTKELRFAAAEALAGVRAPAAVRPLVGVLSDPDRNLRRTAAEALGAIADPQALPALLAALEDAHWSVRCAAAAALGQLRSGKATEALLRRLADEDATVRRAACAALGEIGDARAAPRLMPLLLEPALQAPAAEALRRIGAAALPAIERGFASAPAEARRLLVEALQRLEDRRAQRLLLSALSDESGRVRAEAALALGEAGALDALRPLMELKAHDPSPDVRRAAAQALRKLAPH